MRLATTVHRSGFRMGVMDECVVLEENPHSLSV